MASAETPDIRGQLRTDLVEALARGDKTQAQIAEDFGRGYDAIAQFSSRNGDEIAARKRELHAEIHAESVALWVTDKA